MDRNSNWLIINGFLENLREQAVDIYYEAFRGKLSTILRDDGRGKALFLRILDPEYAICAMTTDKSRLLGIAGFKTIYGSLAGGGMRDIVSVFGWFGATWRTPLLSLLERDIEPDQLLMDGIAVAREGRGSGIGTALLNAIVEEAARRGMAAIRLDVIGENERARSLYERFGFVAQRTEKIGPLKYLFGFRQSTSMTLDISSRQERQNSGGT